jgi:hypothetical protein
MVSPFPGMDPYLEQSAFWASFHSRLIVAIADAVAPQILPKYYIEVETRTYQEDGDSELLVGIPDAVVMASRATAELPKEPIELKSSGVALQNRPQRVQVPMGVEVRERYLEVREVGTDEVVTVIELLSPKNKRVGVGRLAYEAKRQRLLGSNAHFIELDLLRRDAPMPIVGDENNWLYRILVSRCEERPIADLYGFNLQDVIPGIPLPLRAEDREPVIDLQAIFEGIYERSGYKFRLNYRDRLPLPLLSEEELRWVDGLLVAWR